MGAALKPLLKRLAVGSPAALPTLDLDFLAQTYKVSDGTGGMSSVAFADLITFTRSSAAWRFNASGVLEQVPANQPRFDYDPVTLALRGLLIEEQRTNLLLFSGAQENAAWTKFQATAALSGITGPYGEYRKLSATDGQAGQVLQNVAATAGQAYTFTYVVKKTAYDTVRLYFIPRDSSNASLNACFVTLTLSTGAASTGGPLAVTAYSVAQTSDGGYLVSITATTPANTAFLRAQVDFAAVTTGAREVLIGPQQIELGAFPTSYIPTTSAQVTRAADVASVNTLSPWFNPSEGTIFFEGVPLAVAGPVKRAVALTNSTQQNRIVLDLAANTGVTEYLATVGGVSMASITSAAGTAGVAIKMAGVYGATDYRMAAKGVLGTGTAPGGAVPPVIKLELGALVGAQFFNGHIRRIRYWPRRLFDNELQRITA